MKQVRFFPLDKEFKEPSGALPLGSPLRLTLLCADSLAVSEVFAVLTKDGEDDVYYPMAYIDKRFDGGQEFSATLDVTSAGLYRYYFEVRTDDKIYRVGADGDLNAMLGKGAAYTLLVYKKSDSAPEWLDGGTAYQIFVDRFNAGENRLKTKKTSVYRNDWGGEPKGHYEKDGRVENNDIFGGNLRGVTKKLDYLKKLGVTAIYLNPIFLARSNHKYDTADYLTIDPDYGTEDDFKRLCKAAGRRGMRVILDGVFSHTGDDSVYFNKYGSYDSVGAYQGEESAYYAWYRFSKFPDEYQSWWGVKSLPNVDEENKYYLEFITGVNGVARKWLRAGASGWRLDVADELPDGFLDALNKAVKKEKPDAAIIGEVWEDATEKISYGRRRRYFQGGQLDSVMNYPLRGAILDFILNKKAEDLNDRVASLLNNYPKEAAHRLLNVLGSHDTVRILSALDNLPDGARAGGKKPSKDALSRLKVAAALQFTLPGVPLVYYGDEAGLTGGGDPENRRCYPWKKQNRGLLSFYRALGKIRKAERKTLAAGEYKCVLANEGIIRFERGGGGEKLIIIANASDRNYTAQTEGLTDLLTGKPFENSVPPLSAVILKRTDKTASEPKTDKTVSGK